jgi:hypothetical protein
VAAESPFRLASECGGGSSAWGLAFLLAGEVCYAVVELTETALSYSEVGGRGNTLVFERSGLPEPKREGR